MKSINVGIPGQAIPLNLPPGDESVGGGRVIHNASDEEMNATITAAVPRKASDSLERMRQLFIEFQDAKKALDYAATHIQKDWTDWLNFAEKGVTEFRQSRVAISFELRTILETMTDFRKFLLNADSAEALEKLKEFAAVCQQLQALKQTGFLDAVADTLLRYDSAKTDKPAQ